VWRRPAAFASGEREGYFSGMEGFAFVIPIEVRFRDLDAMGHVNNAVFASYFEMGRLALYRALHGADLAARDFDFILARLEVSYRRPVHLDDACRLGVRVAEIGRSSFVIEYRLEAGGELAATGSSVQVFFDYARGEKRPVPDGFRARVAPYLTG
jgi:acyl-CoA thioester hydrolase